MTTKREHEEAIFEGAREIASAAERAAYLAARCGEDAELRKRIEAMLAADASAAEYFQTQQAPAATLRLGTAAFAPLTEKPGDRIGRYKVLQKIGEGGCGVVYMAEQTEPVKRRVALKVIKLGMDTKAVVARFEAERQALAMMDHPNIAKVLDAGATDTGRPYFVMELVRGLRITDYCDQAQLPTRERLELFVQVCQAVQHAHQKGIIHRDLKPSNILVTVNDGVAVPKVIDFGIAKATTGQQLTDKTLFTAYEQFLGTPAYMSPEQAVMTSLDIDTRTDIYSLGVLLYEMLTGRTPFDAQDLLRAGLEEMRRRIREDEPQRPSTRLSTMLAADLTTVAKHQNAQPPALINLLRGDLDWIVMKALDKDRQRRYETANGLAMDVQRHLGNEAVVARPPSQLYRLQKLARRHRGGTIAVAAVAASLLFALTISTWQMVRATRAQRAAQSARRAAEGSQARESEQRHLAETSASKATESERQAQRLLYAADMKLAHAAWEEGNLSRMIGLLETHRPAPANTDDRGFEYYYFQELAKGEQEYVLGAHTNEVEAIAVSPDGKWLASCSKTETRLWDLARRSFVAGWPTGPQSNAKATETRYDSGPSFSRDGQYLAFSSPRGLELYDLSARQLRLAQAGTIHRPFFSPTTNLIAYAVGSSPAKVQMWDYLENREVGVRTGPSRAVWCWAPDGRRLLTGVGGGGAGDLLEWWEVAGFKLGKVHHLGQYLYGATVSRDGRRIAAADWQGQVWLLETAGGKVVGSMDCGDIRSSALDFSPDGRWLATASRDQAILLWDVESRQKARLLRGHRAKVTTLAFTPDGHTLASGDADGKLLLWDLGSSQQRPQLANRIGGFGIEAIHFSPDGNWLALANTEDNCSILSSSTFQLQSSVRGGLLAFSPDSHQAALTFGGERLRGLRVTLVGAASPRATIPVGTGTDRVGSHQLSPDGRFLAIEAVGRLESTLVLDAPTGQRVLCVPHEGSVFQPAAFLPNSRSLVCATRTSLAFWDLESKRKTRSLESASPLLSLAVSPNGRFLAAGGEDSKVYFWDLESTAPAMVLSGHQAWVWALAFSSDGRRLASGGEDRALKLWDLSTRREVASFILQRSLYWLAFSPDDQLLALGGIGYYEVWRAPRGEALNPPSAPALLAAEVPGASLWQVPDGDAPLPPQAVVEKGLCRTNLLKIHTAILAYQKDHQHLPDWLSDLVPQYLADTNLLLCPVHVATQSAPAGLDESDPKLATSYRYTFSARPVSTFDPYGLAAPGDTMKAWKTKQLERYGPVVPLLSCSAHETTLSITYGGEVEESSQPWEGPAHTKWRARNPQAAEEWYRKMEREADAQALNNLAWEWATALDPGLRDGRAAARFAQRAVGLTARQDANYLDTLAAAQAEMGEFDEAVSVQREAISVSKGGVENSNRVGLLPDLERHLAAYLSQRPYHQQP